MINLKNIKNIIFDLGVVILNINPQRSVNEFKEVGIKNFEGSYTLLKQSKIFDLLETGKISEMEFVQEIKKLSKLSISSKSIIGAWNALILDFPIDRIKLLEILQSNYRIFLLSNTNKIHYNYYSMQFLKQFGYEFNSLFEKAYYSFEIGLRKPDIKIFEYVLNDINLIASETLFIDDLQINIEAAKNIGIKTYHLKERECITEIF